MTDAFLATVQCRARAVCATCRSVAEWRRSVGAPDECPYGITSDSIPSIDYDVYSGKADYAINGGPGTELKKLLARIGITATPNCSCNARAAAMDNNEAREPGWCEAHLEEIVGWLREEAEKRGLPFLDVAGRMLVRRAIRNARAAS